MTNEEVIIWQEANRRYLMVSIEIIRHKLKYYFNPQDDNHLNRQADMEALLKEREQIRKTMNSPSALDMLANNFRLSSFEQDIILLCAGAEIDRQTADLCTCYYADNKQRIPNFELALSVFTDPDWSALAPDQALRYWRLIEVGPGDFLTSSPLRIDERILHFLSGTPCLDERLHGIAHPVFESCELSSSQQNIMDSIIKIWSRAIPDQSIPLIQICGMDEYTNQSVSLEACRNTGLGLYKIYSEDIPVNMVERNALVRLLERECLLNNSALLIEYDEAAELDRVFPVRSFIQNFRNILLVSTKEQLKISERDSVRFDIGYPSSSEQRTAWFQALGPLASHFNGQIDNIISHFRMNNSAIHSISNQILEKTEKESGENGSLKGSIENDLWEMCRNRTRPRFSNLARLIKSTAYWDDLVLPQFQKKILKELVANVRQQSKVYEEWGFEDCSPRGLGITVLFHGPSGTGKTMAAEVLANELKLDLYHIDLSTVISKYIGETEKNLRSVFDTAERGGLILLFDEADALFGKRSEVKDSHDRYANIEVSYLLQRMEAYRGLAILTTNNKSALDTAFMRRIRFVIQFPFPDSSLRGEIWKRVFPSKTPVKDLDESKLGRLSVSGGNIRNIALNAAFLAADENRPVTMGDIRNAAQTEYTKIERPLSTAETKDWE